MIGLLSLISQSLMVPSNDALTINFGTVNSRTILIINLIDLKYFINLTVKYYICTLSYIIDYYSGVIF